MELSATETNFLTVSGISMRESGRVVLNNIHFTQQKLQRLAIAGETGSGKSSLLKIIAGLMQPDEGQVFFGDRRVRGPHEKLMPGHPGITYLSQQFELPNNYRVEEVLPFENKLTPEEAEVLYDVCRIRHLLTRRTDQLSGGEKQRIAMARVLIASPKLLLLDEPFSNMDMVHKGILKKVIRDIGERLSISCILISHDPLDTLPWADEMLIMKEGEIIQRGSPAQLYKQPLNEYVAGLLGAYNLIGPGLAKAWYSLWGVKENNRQMLVRPEDFYLTTKQDKAMVGEVKQISFWGGFFELEILISDQAVTVRVDEVQAAVGDSVYVALDPDRVWYV